MTVGVGLAFTCMLSAAGESGLCSVKVLGFLVWVLDQLSLT